MKVIGYTRVSTKGQAEQGCSLGAQEAKLRAYCEAHGHELVDVFADEGVSAKTLDREGLTAALEALDTGKASGLLVCKLDRLTRSLSGLDKLIRGPFSEGKHSLLSVADHIDTSTASGRMMLNLLTTISSWEREVIGERTKEALQHMKAQGKRVGQIPYGKSLGADGSRLEDVQGELAAIAQMKALHRAGLSLRAISGALTEQGIFTRTGKPFSAMTIKRLVS